MGIFDAYVVTTMIDNAISTNSLKELSEITSFVEDLTKKVSENKSSQKGGLHALALKINTSSKKFNLMASSLTALSEKASSAYTTVFITQQQRELETKQKLKIKEVNDSKTQPKMTEKYIEIQKKYDECNFSIPLSINTPIPAKSNKINQEKVGLWIDMHTQPECKAAVSVIIAHTTHVSFEEFEAALETTVEHINKIIDEDPDKRFVIAVENGKSNKWVAELAMKYLKHMPTDVVSIKDFDFKANASSIHRVILFDDAIYSGEQMCRFLDKCKSEDTEPLLLNVVAPFISSFGEKKLEEAKQANARLDIAPHVQMTTMAEEITDPTIQEIINDMYFRMAMHESKDKGMFSRTLFYFDHKIADHLSTLPMIFKEGLVYTREGKTEKENVYMPKTCHFIPTTYEPYKDHTKGDI